MIATDFPYGQCFDLDGKPLTGGKVYYGVAGQSPITAPIAVYWDPAGTQPAAQPIPTLNGYPVRLNSPALVFANSAYSMLVVNAKGQQVFYLADSSSLPSNFAVQLASSGGASVGAGLVGYSYLNSYQSGTAGQKLNSLGVWAVADLGMDPTGAVDCLAKLQAALTAGRVVRFEPGLFALSAAPVAADGCGIIGSGAHWDRRTGYDYDPTRQTIFKYTGSAAANSCVINASSLAVGTQGTDFTTPGTDDLVDAVFKDFHIDCNGVAEIGLNVYRSGNGSYVGNITVEKAKKRGVVITGAFAAEYGLLASYQCAEHGVDVCADYFGWGTAEGTGFGLKASFVLVGNGTAATYVKGTGTDLDGSGGIFAPGRGSDITIDSESNVGRACRLSQYNQANVAGGSTVYRLNYVEANGDGAYIDYRTATDGMRITTGFIHPGSASLAEQNFKLEAKNNSGVVTANDGPPNASEWLIFENLQGNLYRKGFAIDANTYKFKVRDCDSGIRFPTRRPQPEGVFAHGLFLADATLSDTRYVKGQTISDAFSGDGVTVDFTLTQAPTSAALTEVYVNGVVKTPTTQYTVTGTTLHFTAGNEPPASSVIVARYSNLKLSRTSAGRYQIDFGDDQPDVEYSVNIEAIQIPGPKFVIGTLRSKLTTGFEIDTVDIVASATTLADTGAFIKFTVSRLVDLP